MNIPWRAFKGRPNCLNHANLIYTRSEKLSINVPASFINGLACENLGHHFSTQLQWMEKFIPVCFNEIGRKSQPLHLSWTFCHFLVHWLYMYKHLKTSTYCSLLYTTITLNYCVLHINCNSKVGITGLLKDIAQGIRWKQGGKEYSPNPFCTFQDMARTGNTYEKWLRGDNTVNIQSKIMVLGFCPSPHCHLSIYQVWFKCHQ